MKKEKKRKKTERKKKEKKEKKKEKKEKKKEEEEKNCIQITNTRIMVQKCNERKLADIYPTDRHDCVRVRWSFR